MQTNTLPEILWHGTNESSAQMIARCGVLGVQSHWAKPSVCLSNARDIALHFALIACQQDIANGLPARPVLLAVPRNAIDTTLLRPDVVMLGAPVRRPQYLSGDDEDVETLLAKHKDTTWQGSLDTVASVVHVGPIALGTVVADVSVSNLPTFATEEAEMLSEKKGIWPIGTELPATPRLHTYAPPVGPLASQGIMHAIGRNGKEVLHGLWTGALATILGVGAHDVSPLPKGPGLIVHGDHWEPGRWHVLTESIAQAFHNMDAPMVITGACPNTGLLLAHVAKFHRVVFQEGARLRNAAHQRSSCAVLFSCKTMWCLPKLAGVPHTAYPALETFMV